VLPGLLQRNVSTTNGKELNRNVTKKGAGYFNEPLKEKKTGRKEEIKAGRRK